MGLRYRKRIKLFKGVHLNIGKNGVSLSAGIPGLRKTIHSSGRVTTSIGIPGTGVYYTDTKDLKKETPLVRQKLESESCERKLLKIVPETSQKKVESDGQSTNSIGLSNQTSLENNESNIKITPKDGRKISCVDTLMKSETTSKNNTVIKSESSLNNMNETEILLPVPEVNIYNDLVTHLFENCDYPIKWIDVLTEETPTDKNYNLETWEYLRSKVIDVFEGNIDTMIDIVEHINPYDDLLDYLTDFEFEADDAECLSIKCKMLQTSLGKEKSVGSASVIIRLARDTFALLPVSRIILNVDNIPAGISGNAAFERDTFASFTFENKNPIDLLNCLCR